MSRTTVAATAVAGALFLGYCIYFDRQRRGAKDFKKKLHDKRQERSHKGKKVKRRFIDDF